MRRTRKLFEEIDKLFDEMFHERIEDIRRGRREVIGPFHYGFSVTIGPDGLPRVREWGNIRPGIRPRISEAIEPFTDVIEEESIVRIVVDVPGVEREDIKVETTETEVRISAERGERKYFKAVKLPARVRPGSAKATYKNGVLTITIEKVERGGREGGVRVEIE